MFNEVLGTEVAVPESPRRVVSFSPAATETLFLLGLGDNVAGVSAFCARPAAAKAKRRLGSYSTVRPEVLDQIAPDLIFTVTGYQRDFGVGLSKRYPVYPLELPVSVSGIVDFVTKVGLVAGAPDQARELGGKLLRRVGQLRTVSGLTGYVELDLGGPVTFGAYSYITDAFSLLGCNQIYKDSRVEWLTPDFGDVASLNPDLVLYEPKMFTDFDETDLELLVQSRGWSGLRAVRSGNVLLTPGQLDFLAHHGPSFITEALPWLERVFVEAKERVVS